MFNAILEQIHQVLVKLVWMCNITETYVGEDAPLFGILTASKYSIHSTNSLNGYSLGQLLFGRYMILLIKHEVGWELLRQRK